MASPAFRINGGAVGVPATVAAAGAVSATLDSTDGVRQVEWWIASTDETSLPADYTLVQSGSVGQTVTTTALGLGTAAILQARINGGINLSTGLNDDTTSATGKFNVLTAANFAVGCVNELVEQDSVFGWCGVVNPVLRAFPAASVLSLGVTAPILNTGTATDPVIDIDDATAATADKVATRTSGALLQAAGFTNGSGTKASAGTVRGSSTETIVAFRDAGNSVDIEAVSSQGDDKSHLGATTNGQGTIIHAPSSKSIVGKIGATDYSTLDDLTLTLGTAIVASRTNSARSIMSTDLLSGTKGAAIIDHRSDAAYVPTPDATPLVVCSVTVAERASVSINFTVMARDSSTRDTKWFHRNVTAKCESGVVSIGGTGTPFADTDDGGTTAVTTIAVGNTADTVTITATGIASAVDWYTGIESKSLIQ